MGNDIQNKINSHLKALVRLIRQNISFLISTILIVLIYALVVSLSMYDFKLYSRCVLDFFFFVLPINILAVLLYFILYFIFKPRWSKFFFFNCALMLLISFVLFVTTYKFNFR